MFLYDLDTGLACTPSLLMMEELRGAVAPLKTEAPCREILTRELGNDQAHEAQQEQVPDLAPGTGQSWTDLFFA